LKVGDLFENAEREFFRLKGQLAAGRITTDQFEAALKELIVEDAHGKFWMLGADSGKWYLHDGQAWVEATPPAVAEGKAKAAPMPPMPPPHTPKPPSQISRRMRAIVGTVFGGLATLLIGLAMMWGQGAVRTALFGGGAMPTLVGSRGSPSSTQVALIQTATPSHTATSTPASTPTLAPSPQDSTPSVIVVTATQPPPTNAPTSTNTVAPAITVIIVAPPPQPSPQIIVVTATPRPPTNMPTSTPTLTRTSTPIARTATGTPSPIPTFPSSAITWSLDYDQATGKPINIVTNKTFTPRPLKIFASWIASGITAGTKLENTWYYGGAVWAQGEYVLSSDGASLWYSTFRTDQQPLTAGTYRIEIKVAGKAILTDEVVVR
jgi:hypothetical protein